MPISVINQHIELTPQPQEWSAAVLSPDGYVVHDLRGEQPHRAASLGKLLIAVAAAHSGIPSDREVHILESDRRPGDTLQHFPERYATTLGSMVTQMCAGSNTAAVTVARVVRGKGWDTAGIINDIVLGYYDISRDTRLAPKEDDRTRFTYGRITAIDAANLLQACLLDPHAARGLRHGSMWFGAREYLEDITGTPRSVQIATAAAHAAQRFRDIVPLAFYDRLLQAEWPETAYPNKEGSDNDAEGNVRSEAIVFPHRHALAIIHSTDSANGTIEPPYGPSNPDYKTFAAVGQAVNQLWPAYSR